MFSWLMMHVLNYKGLEEILNGPRTNISVKRMGEIDVKVFQQTCKGRFPPDEAEIKAVELCTLWQDNMKNPEWHPFKIVSVQGNSQHQVLQWLDEFFKHFCAMNSYHPYLECINDIFCELALFDEYYLYGRKLLIQMMKC